MNGDPQPQPHQIYYEDVVPGAILRSSDYRLLREEIIAFAAHWDPFPWHVDEHAARASPFGGLTAAGVHLMAIKQRLVHEFPIGESVICTTGFDEVRFARPARPGDTLRLSLIWQNKRISSSKPDRGIVRMRFELTDEKNELVLSFFDTILMRLRQPLTETA